MLRIVLDTNQFISSIITEKGTSAQLFRAWREHAYILITSKEILKEVERVIQYPHITKKYHLRINDVNSLIQLIEHEAIILPYIPSIDIIKDDPTDNKILACAIEANAQYIVSGDNHLLNICKYKDIAIVTAREFLRIIGYNI